MIQITISVIIPVYNSEKYIKKCIDSVLSQSFSDFEIIAVDDGSTDSSLSILKSISKDGPELKVFTKENGGVSSARNFGLDKAKGEYIAFVDSDDTIPENAFKTLINSIDDGIDLISGSYKLCGTTDKDIIHKNTRFKNNERLSRFTEQDRTNWGPCGKLYRKSIIDSYKIRFREDISYCEDHIFNLNYTKNITKDMVVLSDIVYCYNNSLRDNLCSRSIEEMAYTNRLLFETILDYFGGNIDKRIYESYLYSYIKGSVEHYIVRFPKKKQPELIENTFKEFDKYVNEDFISSRFSPDQSRTLKEKNYSDFISYYLSENKNLKKRILKNRIKRILMLFI